MDEAEGSHLTRAELAAPGRLGQERTRVLLAHLLRGCAACRSLLRGLGTPDPPGAPADEAGVDPYELPVARVLARVREEAERLAWSRVEANLRFAAALEAGQLPEGAALDPDAVPQARWAWCEVLVDAAAELRQCDDPAEALFSAALAVGLAEELAGGPYPPGALADLQARAYMELGNLRRIRENLDAAEDALATARSRLAAGTGDPRLAARLCDLYGSLYRDQRHFGEAQEALDLAVRGHQACGEPHLAGRSLLKAGMALYVAGEPDQALRRFAHALALIEPHRDPALALAVLHNLLAAQAETGRAQQAERLLWRVRPLYKRHGSAAHRLRLLWLEAQIALGLGQRERAERLFRRTKEGFEQAGQIYVASVVGLELSVVLLERGRPAEVLTLVEKTLGVFSRMGIEREAILAVLVLHQALRQGEATAALARQVVAELRRLDLKPRGDSGDPA